MSEVAQLSGHASYVRKVAFCEQSGVVFSASQTTVKVCSRVEGRVHDTVVQGGQGRGWRESGERVVTFHKAQLFIHTYLT